MKTTRLLPLFVSASLLGTFGHGSAQILTWDPDPAAGIQNGSGIWSSTDANWTADGGATNVAWSDGSTAELTGGSKTLTLGGANAVDGITRTGTGETIIIGTATDTLAISGVVEADAFLTFRGNDPAAMSGSFEKTGGGQLAMQNTAFNFSSITLSAGTLTYYFTSPAPTTAFALNGGAVGSTTTTGRTFGGPVTIGGNVGIGSDTPSIDQAGAMIFNNTIDLTGGSRTITTGTGGTTFNGIVSNGSLVKEGGGSLFLTAANTLSSVTVNEGIVVGSNGIAFNGTQGGAFGPGAITVNSGATLRTTTVFNIGGQNTTRVINLVGGAADLDGAGAGGEYIRTVNMTGGSINSTPGDDWFRAPNGGISLNSFASATPSSVTLRMDLTLGGLVADVEEGPAGRDLVISGDITENTGAGSGARTLTKNGGGTLHLSGVSTYTGATTVSEGCLTVEDYTSIPNVTLVSVAPGAGFGGVVGPSHLLDADIQDFVDNVAWDAGGGSFLVIDTNGADITVAADITGDIGLIKKGDGVLTLSGNNTYTGATIIEGGSIGAGGAITEVMISKSGTDVTLTFTSSGNVDVYRSTDLQNWGDAYASNQSSPYTDTAATGDRMFYVLVPTGQAAP